MLRERLGLTGTKKAATMASAAPARVLLNGRRVNACPTLTVMHEGDEIRTIEALTDTTPGRSTDAAERQLPQSRVLARSPLVTAR
jgi:aerobic-type carbon monoxide dehydrogenase small subunit (CoxS/CutS family)